MTPVEQMREAAAQQVRYSAAGEWLSVDVDRVIAAIRAIPLPHDSAVRVTVTSDEGPDLGASSREPSLKNIIYRHYLPHMTDDSAMAITERYLATIDTAHDPRVVELEAQVATLKDALEIATKEKPPLAGPWQSYGGAVGGPDCFTGRPMYAGMIAAIDTAPDPRVEALVEAGKAMLDAFCIHEASEQVEAYEAMCAALAAWKGGAA